MLFFYLRRISKYFSQQTYKAPEFLIKPSNRTVHEGQQFQIFSKVIGKAFQVISLRFFIELFYL